MIDTDDILHFWFGEPPLKPNMGLWWGGKKNDALLKRRFGRIIEEAVAGDFDSWERAPRSSLALILLLDQMTRNVFRGSARAFAGDARALAVTQAGLEAGYVDQLHPLEAAFFLMPLEHHEDLSSQDRCIVQLKRLISRAAPADREGLQGNLDYARRHREVIERFGRYPHRNEVLGRANTADEERYLKSGGARFGQ